ncbi:MAG: type II toxin-antitoxin system VapB family antitoxin [Cyanobium sp.]
MNIKDPVVHAMARELAARRGTTVTDAVRQALLQELERDRCADISTKPAQVAKQQELLQLLQSFQSLPWADARSSRELQDELYDEAGLPR